MCTSFSYIYVLFKILIDHSWYVKYSHKCDLFNFLSFVRFCLSFTPECFELNLACNLFCIYNPEGLKYTRIYSIRFKFRLIIELCDESTSVQNTDGFLNYTECRINGVKPSLLHKVDHEKLTLRFIISTNQIELKQGFICLFSHFIVIYNGTCWHCQDCKFNRCICISLILVSLCLYFRSLSCHDSRIQSMQHFYFRRCYVKSHKL